MPKKRRSSALTTPRRVRARQPEIGLDLDQDGDDQDPADLPQLPRAFLYDVNSFQFLCYIGEFTTQCTYCLAFKFPNGTQGMFCSNGKVDLQLFPEPPPEIESLFSGESVNPFFWRRSASTTIAFNSHPWVIRMLHSMAGIHSFGCKVKSITVLALSFPPHKLSIRFCKCISWTVMQPRHVDTVFSRGFSQGSFQIFKKCCIAIICTSCNRNVHMNSHFQILTLTSSSSTKKLDLPKSMNGDSMLHRLKMMLLFSCPMILSDIEISYHTSNPSRHKTIHCQRQLEEIIVMGIGTHLQGHLKYACSHEWW
ncbi:hypothetical protein PoB_005669600 [Plakobranchus ocellatus]|uniref:Uncharacterized protein n=1 Tax=Plakobranchus ocellatus TaxID=259542 RepID=A0AAV4C4D6_9GAST|nr:hypothetical protein PoB_005669600 [Plakobranchus ocellatus]